MGSNFFGGIADFFGKTLLGFQDEDIYSTSVSSCKVFNEKLLPKTRTRLLLDYVKQGSGIIDYNNGFVSVGHQQLSKYHNYGKSSFIDKLPDVAITSTSLSFTNIENILKAKNPNKLIHVIDIIVNVPTDKEWCRYQLQEKYNYDIGEDLLITNNNYYELKSITYNKDNNTFTVVMTPIPKLTKIKYELRRITVQKKANTPNILKIDKYQYYAYNRETNNSFLYRTNLTYISTAYQTDATGSVGNSEETEVVSQEIVTNSVTTPITYNINNHEETIQYITKYVTLEDGKLHYWLYDPKTNSYPTVTTPTKITTSLTTLPIVTLRNNKFDTIKYDKNSDRYKTTVEMLRTVGLTLDELTDAYSNNESISKIQDVFFLFGVSPSNLDWSVSRVLYEIFDFIYDRFPFVYHDTQYQITFKEGVFNSYMEWKSAPTLISENEWLTINNKRAMVGDCQHYFQNTTVTTEKYLIEITVKEGYRYTTTYYTETVKTDSVFGELSRVRSQPITEQEADNLLNPPDEDGGYNDNSRIAQSSENITRTLLESSSVQVDHLVIKCQIEPNTTKRLIINDFHCSIVIKEGVDNGGVTLGIADKNLVFPLPEAMIGRLSIMEKTAVLGESAYMMFFALDHKHLKWYETEAFGNFLKIVSIGITVIVTIVTFGTGTAGSMTLTAALWAAVKAVAIGVTLQLALQLISTLVDDVALKIALSVAAMALAAWAGGAFAKFNLTFAANLVEIASKACEIYVKESAIDFNKKVADFTSEYNKRASKNEQILKELNSGLTVGEVTDIVTAENEANDAMLLSPTQFFDLALHSYRDFDFLFTGFYDNSVHKFIDNRLAIGVQDGNI